MIENGGNHFRKSKIGQRGEAPWANFSCIKDKIMVGNVDNALTWRTAKEDLDDFTKDVHRMIITLFQDKVD